VSGDRTLWSSGEAYEQYVGRWSRLVAPEFLRWLAPESGRSWIDVGCGTGELSAAIAASAEPTSVVGIDPSEAHLAFARERFGGDGRVTFAAGNAQDLPCEDASADYVVSGLVLNFADDPKAAVVECSRVTKPGGVVAAYVWDYGGEMQMMRYFWDAAAHLDTMALDFDEAARYAMCRPEALSDMFAAAGLSGMATRAIDVPTVFLNFDDYWRPFLSGQAPAPRYAMSLSEERRVELRELLRSRLPTATDGSIALIARAWAVKGVRA
jgi:SAM-dependent methyltransferase